MNFDLDVFTLKKLISEVDLTLSFFLEVECADLITSIWIESPTMANDAAKLGKVTKADVVNYEDVKRAVLDRLNQLLVVGKREGAEGTWPERDARAHLMPPSGM